MERIVEIQIIHHNPVAPNEWSRLFTYTVRAMNSSSEEYFRGEFNSIEEAEAFKNGILQTISLLRPEDESKPSVRRTKMSAYRNNFTNHVFFLESKQI